MFKETLFTAFVAFSCTAKPDYELQELQACEDGTFRDECPTVSFRMWRIHCVIGF